MVLFCHNFSGYDCHFILPRLGSVEGITRLSCLPRNTEKLRTLNINMFCLQDSMAFLQCGLQQLCENLKNDGHDFAILDQLDLYSDRDAHVKKELLLRKQVFPYEYCTSLAKMRDTKRLPPPSDFKSLLSNTTGVSPEEYAFAEHVFATFDCQNLVDYCNLYCLSDVAILAESFCKFRTICRRMFDLDAAKYLSLPSLSYSCMLKLSRVQMGLLAEHDQQLFVESHLKGGFAFVGERHYQLDEEIDAEGRRQALIILDVNNLYGRQMTRPLSVGSATWMKRKDFSQIDWSATSEDDPHGYIVECDLSFPLHTHRWFASFPPAPEKMKVTRDMLSSYQLICNDIQHGKQDSPFVTHEKLIASLNPRIRYGIHYLHLRTLVNLGISLDKVHKVLRFKQERFVKSFVEKCTELRKHATSTFDKSCWKLM